MKRLGIATVGNITKELPSGEKDSSVGNGLNL